MDAIKLMDAKFSLLLIRRSLVQVQQGEPKKDHPIGWSFFAPLARLRQRSFDHQTAALPTERARKVAKAIPRCRWQMQGYCFVCRGRKIRGLA